MLKKIAIILLASLMFFSLTPVEAASQAKQDGKISKKDEVIYANLHADGSENEMYVVNALHVKKSGTLTDYGKYTHLKNLTDMTEMNQKKDKNNFRADKGKFYYQGTLEGRTLPWQFKVTYKLDGEEMSAEELLGQTGELEIALETKHDKKIDQTFHENYLLQISLTFDGEKTENIKAEEGTLANNGKKELVNLTVMPKEDAKFKVIADVEDFEMEGIQISAIPANIAIDMPDTDDMIGDMKSLVDAIAALDEGIGELQTGTQTLKEGSDQLADGSLEFKNGLNQLSDSSGQLIDGSKEIQSALTQVKAGLEDFDLEAVDFNSLENIQALEDDFRQALDMMAAMDETADDVKQAFEEIYNNVDAVTQELRDAQLTDEDIAALKESDLDDATVDRIIAMSESSQEALEMIENTKPTLAEVKAGLVLYEQPIQEALKEIEAVMQTIDDINIEAELKSMMQMVDGLKQLATEYNQFHNGLSSYVNGVGELSRNYASLHGGIVDLNEGIGELSDGVGDLKAGSHELASQTSNLPKEMTEEIDKMLAEYDMSDFEPVSYVSDKNKNIDVVQFVIQTENIQKPDKDDAETEKKEDLSFWQKIKNLFKRDK